MSIGLVTAEAVRDALKAMRRNDTIGDNPLLQLGVLPRRLAADGLAVSKRSRQWALGQVLAELVDAALIEARSVTPEVVVSHQDPERLLAADFTGGHEAREAWSAIYYHYLAPERYRIKQLVTLTGFSPAHLWRRRQLGFELLAEALRAREALAERATDSSATPDTNRPDSSELPAASEADRDLVTLKREMLSSLREHGRPIPLSDREARRLVLRPATTIVEYRLGRYVHWSRTASGVGQGFVPLSLELQQDYGDEEPGGRWQTVDRRFDDISGALEAVDAPAVVLLGPPGSGKSTLLGAYERDLALAGLRADPDRRPLTLFAQLNGYDAKFESPSKWLERLWQRRNPGLPALRELLEQGRMILLLDGLNEVPHSDAKEYWNLGHAWQSCIAELAELSPENRMVFSCRSLDYSAPLSTPQFTVPQLRIETLDRSRAIEIVRHWTGLDRDQVERALRELAAPEIITCPFFLRLLAEQLAESPDDPRVEGRALLISHLVHRALRREMLRYNPRFGPGALFEPGDLRQMVQSQPRFGQIGSQRSSPLLEGLTRLAYGMQSGRQADGRPQHRIGREEALDLLEPLPREALAAGSDLGLLDEDLDDGATGFTHQLLQDYFVARQLARHPEPTRLDHPWRADEVEPHLEQALRSLPAGEPMPPLPRSAWEESSLLAVELSTDPEAHVEALAETNVVLAGRATRRLGSRLSRSSQERIRHALLQRAGDPQADLRARIDAARALGRLGDPRFEPAQGPDGRYLRPPMIDVPRGAYHIRSLDNEPETPAPPVHVGAFQIGRFAVTNAEYACFVDSGGYEDGRWWDTPAARAWQRGESTAEGRREAWRMWRRRFLEEPELLDTMRADGRLSPAQHESWGRLIRLDPAAFEALLAERFEDVRRSRPRYWEDPDYNHPAQPVVGVSWFEARAYGLWLSSQSGQAYRLPSEAEWEAAARRDRDWQYAWGDELDPLRANVLATRLQRPAPVGVFVDGQTPEGLFDITGNTQDWTSSIACPHPYDPLDGREDPGPGDVERVIRGGAFYGSPETVRCTYRFRFDPRFRRLRSTGFRLACSV